LRKLEFAGFVRPTQPGFIRIGIDQMHGRGRDWRAFGSVHHSGNRLRRIGRLLRQIQIPAGEPKQQKRQDLPLVANKNDVPSSRQAYTAYWLCFDASSVSAVPSVGDSGLAAFRASAPARALVPSRCQAAKPRRLPDCNRPIMPLLVESEFLRR